jgi:hypothetical protein
MDGILHLECLALLLQGSGSDVNVNFTVIVVVEQVLRLQPDDFVKNHVFESPDGHFRKALGWSV